MILADIGEIGIHQGGAVYKLRPSLYAISKIGNPAEIVQVYSALHMEHFTKRGKTEQFVDALGVLYACADGDWCAEVFGSYTPAIQQRGRHWKPGKYRPGIVPAAHIVTLARNLLKHGVIGDLPPLPRNADSEARYDAEFVPRDYVAMAQAHLGCSELEAWSMTMTGLALAMRSKYPPQSSKETPGVNAPSSEEHDAAMAWLERVNKLRTPKNG